MLLIKNHIGISNISGIGLFSSEFIPKGSIIWQLDKLDQVFSYNEVEKLLDIHKEYILKYSYTEKGNYILCSDNAKYFNHSFNPNVETIDLYEISKRDIKIGEELTCDYFKINDDHSRPIFKQLQKLTKI